MISSKKFISYVLIAILSISSISTYGDTPPKKASSILFGCLAALWSGIARYNQTLPGQEIWLISIAVCGGTALGFGLDQAYYAEKYGYHLAWGLAGAALGTAALTHGLSAIAPSHSHPKSTMIAMLGIAALCAFATLIFDDKENKPERKPKE